ncbi:MAG TPA: hypothetical protein VI322_00385 [Candidatus Saccharimonadia bacterium]
MALRPRPGQTNRATASVLHLDDVAVLRKTQGIRRLKSVILFVAFLMFMVAGPLHDVARTAEQYAVADLLTIVGVIVMGTGVALRLRQGVTLDPAQPLQPPQPRPVMAPSNTV